MSNITFNESFADLQSFKNAINGESGTITEMISGTLTAVSYHHPVKAFSNVWTVLFMQPHGDDWDMLSGNTIVTQNDLVIPNEQEELVMVKDPD